MVTVFMAQTTAKARVASIVETMMAIVLVMMHVIMMMMNGYRNLNVNRHRFFDCDRNVFVHMNWIWTVDGDLNGIWDRTINGVRNVFFDSVRLWHGNLYRIGDGSFDMHRIWSVDGHFNFVRNGLLDNIWNWFFHWHRIRLWHMNGIGSIDRYVDGVRNLLFDWVRLWYGNGHFDGVRNVFGHFVRLGHGHFDLIRNMFGNFVGLGHEHFDGIWSIDGHMNGIGDFLFDRVRLGHVDGNFNVFFDRVRNVLNDFVRLRYANLNGIWNMFFDRVRNMFFHWIWNWDALKQRYGLVHVCVSAQVDTMSVAMMMMVMIVGDQIAVSAMMVIGTANVSTAQITNV